MIQDILKHVHDKGQGTGPQDEVGSVLYTRGLIIQMLGVEAVRRAQERFGFEDFGLSRIVFRELAREGKIPGVKKASW